MTFPKQDSYDTYGGDLKDKKPSKNFHQVGATDLPAEDFNQCRASLAGATNTSFQCYIKFNSDNNELEQYEPAWDKIKTGLPSISEFDTGVWLVTFPAIYYDKRGIKQNMNILGMITNTDQTQIAGGGSSQLYQSSGQVLSPNTALFYTLQSGQAVEDIMFTDLFFF